MHSLWKKGHKQKMHPEVWQVVHHIFFEGQTTIAQYTVFEPQSGSLTEENQDSLRLYDGGKLQNSLNKMQSVIQLRHHKDPIMGLTHMAQNKDCFRFAFPELKNEPFSVFCLQESADLPEKNNTLYPSQEKIFISSAKYII